MIRFFDIFSGIGGFSIGPERAENAATINIAHLCLNAAHEASMGATGVRKEAA